MPTEPKVKHLKEISKRVDQFGMDHYKNIQLIVEYAGEHLGATAALYNRKMDGNLITQAEWRAPDDMPRVDNPEGHLCSDVIDRGVSKCLVVTNLQDTPYSKSDPNVSRYNLHTYAGYGVECKSKTVGSLCVVYDAPKDFTEFEEDILRILGTFIGIEEDRIAKEEESLKSIEFLNTLVEDSLDMIIGVDSERRIVRFNSAARKRFGYCLEDVVYKNVGMIYASEEESMRVFESLIDKGSFFGEVQNIDSSGNVFTSLLSASMLYSRYGDYLGTVGISRDITEEKKAQEKLKESENRFRLLTDLLPTPIMEMDLDGVITYGNVAAGKIFGYTKYDVENRSINIKDIVYENDKSKLIFFMNKILKDGFTTSGNEYRLITSDGKIIYSLLSSSPIHNSDGNITGIRSSVTDITHVKEMERQLQERETRLNAIVNTATDAIIIIDSQGKVIFWNKSAEDMFGYNDVEAVGSTLEFIMPQRFRGAHRIGLTKAISPNKSLEHCVVGSTVELTGLRKDGVEFPLELSLSRWCSGEDIFFTGIIRDITEKVRALKIIEESKEKYQFLVENSGELIWSTDINLNYTYISPSCHKLTGYSQSELLNSKVQDHFPPEEMDKFAVLFIDRLEREDYSPMVIEAQTYNKFKELNWTEISVAFILDKYGKPTGFQGVSRDITDKVKARKALEESEEKFRFLIENSPQLFWIVDLDLNYTYMSPLCYEIIGYTQEEMYASNVVDHFPEKEIDMLLDLFATRLKEKNYTPELVTVQTYTKSKEIRWQEIYMSFIMKDGVPVGIQGVSRDITERVEMEQSLLRRDSILQAVSYTADKFLNTNSWEVDIQDVLKKIGEATGVSRVYIFKNYVLGDILYSSHLYEWCDAQTTPQINNINLINIPMENIGYKRWVDNFKANRPIIGLTESFPVQERELLEFQDIKSILVLPIIIDSDLWGFIGFDDCRLKRIWSDVEVDALRVVTSTLTAGIQRDIRKKIEEQKELERWAEAEKNVMINLKKHGRYDEERESKQMLFKALTLMNESDGYAEE